MRVVKLIELEGIMAKPKAQSRPFWTPRSVKEKFSHLGLKIFDRKVAFER